MKNDTQEGRRYAEAMPHIEQRMRSIRCTICDKAVGMTIGFASGLSDEFVNNFLTKHRHKESRL